MSEVIDFKQEQDQSSLIDKKSNLSEDIFEMQF